MAGYFIDSDVAKKLSRKRGLEAEEYESMVSGKWAWSNNGETHNHFVVFNEDNTCSFQNLEDRTIMAYEGQYKWKILIKSL